MGFFSRIINKHTLSLASNAVMPVVGMVTVSLLARNLTKGDFGNWILFLITFTLTTLLRSGFLQTSLVKFYSGAEEKRKRTIAGSTWYLGFAITSVLATLGYLLFILYKGDPSLMLIAKWFGIIFFCTLPSSVALWILQAEERFDRVFFLQLMGQGFFLTSVIILSILHKTQFQVIIYAYMGSAAMTSLLAMLFGWARVAAIPYRTRECIRELINFGKYSVGTSVSSYLLKSSDTFIIKFMLIDPAVVGIYYLPQRLMELIEIPLRSFISTALPAMSAALTRSDKKQVTYILKKYAGILTILLIPILLVATIGADLFINLIGGQNFVNTDAANVFRIFMCFAILLPVDRFFGVTLDILNKPQFNLAKVLIMLVVNVAGDFIGIYFTHNLYGVAISSIFTFLAGVIYGYWILKKHLNFTMTEILVSGVTEIRSLAGDWISRLSPRTFKP